MADVLFRYLLMARDRDQSWYRRAFLAEDRALAACVERIEQTAAVRVGLGAQRERVSQVSATYPASKARKVVFFDEATPNPPVAPLLETRTDRFPLASTFETTDCFDCEGRGFVDCPSLQDRQHHHCRRCNGSRFVTHEKCAGEGRVSTWTETEHRYWVDWTHELELPPDANPRALSGVVERWLATHDETVEDARLLKSSEHLGYDTQEAAAVIAAAELRRANLERLAPLSLSRRSIPGHDRCLFTVSTFEVVPVASCIVRSESEARAERYWLVGRDDQAMELRPAPSVDRWKLAGWPALLIGATNGIGAAMQGSSLVMESLAAGGLVVGAVGLKRVLFNRREPVRTVAILPATDAGATYLTCVVTLGAFVRELEIFDTGYKAHLEALMGQGTSPTQSQSVVVGLPGHKRVRLTQLARPTALSRGEFARMGEIVDGIVYLESHDRTSGPLRSMVHGATTARPPESKLLLNSKAASPEDAVSLEQIRRAFTREIEIEVDWKQVFSTLWEPIAAVLARKKHAAIWPSSPSG